MIFRLENNRTCTILPILNFYCDSKCGALLRYSPIQYTLQYVKEFLTFINYKN